MAEALNWIINDSQHAAEVYSSLVEASDVDSKMWDFLEMRKDHEQIVGHLKRTLAEAGMEAEQKTRGIWPELKRHPALRVYEDREALQALRDAEKAELEECQKLMTMSADNRRIHTLIASNVMPVLHAHIDTLDRYLHQARAD